MFISIDNDRQLSNLGITPRRISVNMKPHEKKTTDKAGGHWCLRESMVVLQSGHSCMFRAATACQGGRSERSGPALLKEGSSKSKGKAPTSIIPRYQAKDSPHYNV